MKQHKKDYAYQYVGIQFFRSSNGVVLSSGINGVIPTVCFLKVVDAKTGRKLT